MRKDFGAKPMLYPQPVLLIATYNDDGTPNVMNAAWGGMYDTTQVALCLSDDHRTTRNIKARGAFTVSSAVAEHVVAADYVGIVSGDKAPDKVARAGFHVTASAHVDAPLIDEMPLALECAFDHMTEDGIVIGRIVNVAIDEAVLDAAGSLDLGKFHPIVFDPMTHAYHAIGAKVGQAFSDGMQLK